MQNLLKMAERTSSVTSSPLTSPSASTAARRSIVQKSSGRSSAGDLRLGGEQEGRCEKGACSQARREQRSACTVRLANSSHAARTGQAHMCTHPPTRHS